MKRITLFSAILLLIISQAYSQKPITVMLKAKNDGLILSESNSSHLLIKTGINKIKFNTKTTKQGEFVELSSEGLLKIYDEGKPNLPVFSKLIEIPVGAEVVLKVLSYDEEIINLKDYGIKNQIIPAIPSVSKSDDYSKIEYKKNNEIYGSKSFYSPETVFVEESGIMRNSRIGRIQINPFNYNPVTNQLKVLNNLVVEVTFKNSDISKTDNLKTKYSSPFFNNSVTLNKLDVSSKALITSAPVTYVIVSDRMFQAQLDPFITWKKLKGFHVITAYTDVIGTTTTAIKAYLQNLYLNPEVGVNAPSFVLLVGDVQQIPAWSGSAGSHYTDLRYCEYTGDDLPEVFYGRFSAQTTEQLQPQIDKTLEYEKYLMPDPLYLKQVLLVPGDDETYEDKWGNGQINYGTTYYFNSTNNINSHTFLQDYPTGDAAVHDSIIVNVNKGVAFANYTAHCSTDGWADPSFLRSDLTGLTNNHKYGLWVGNCCQSLTYNDSETFGEKALRQDRGGAIGYIGCSNYSYWDEDYWWGVGNISNIVTNPTYEGTGLGTYDGIFHNLANEINNTSSWYTAQGQILTSGNLAVQASTSPRKQYYWEIYNLMGDPSIVNYMGIPALQTVTLNPEVLFVGFTSIAVNTSPYAYIALTQDEELLGVALADADGNAEITFTRSLGSNPLTIVVTAQNKIPYIEEIIPGAPSEPYVSISSNSTTLSADYGVTTGVNITLKNFAVLESGNDAINTNAIISSTDEFVTVNDNTENYGTILAGTSSEILSAYEIMIAENVPDNHKINFTMAITADASYTWNSKFSIIAKAPSLDLTYSNVNDIPAKSIIGNSNSILDAGETVDILSVLYNSGHAILTDAVCDFSSTNQYVTINSPSLDISSLGIDKSIDIIANISVDAQAPVGEVIDLTYTVTSGLFSYTKTIYIKAGLIFEDFETGNLSAFPWVKTGNSNWSVITDSPYEGTYCSVSGTILDYQESALSMSLIISNESEISFFSKVSSESGYDFLRFSIDGILKDQWSGEESWAEHKYPVTAGSHIFKWSYEKDESESVGQDKAWLDYIVFPDFDKSVGIEIVSDEISIYPNPNRGNFHVDLKEKSNSSVEITNISGQVVYKKILNNLNNEIKLNGFSKGIYFVKVTNGTNTYFDKIVIE